MTDDQIVLQQSSKEILKLLENGKIIPDPLVKKWIDALILTHHHSNEVDADTNALCDCLCALHIHRDTHSEAFDCGVIYGLFLCAGYYYTTIIKARNDKK